MLQDIIYMFEQIDILLRSKKCSEQLQLLEQAEETITKIQDSLTKDDQKYNRTFAQKIVELQQINSFVHDQMYSLNISLSQIQICENSACKTKSMILGLQVEQLDNLKRKITQLAKTIFNQNNIPNPQELKYHQFEELSLLRLYQLFIEEVDNLKNEFQYLLNQDDETFKNIHQQFQDIINEEQFNCIKSYLANKIELRSLLEQYKIILIKYFAQPQLQKKSASFLEYQMKPKSRSFSEMNEKFEHYHENQPKVEITNKRKESSSETCINCSIF